MTNERKILLMCGVGHFYAHLYMLMFPSLALWIRNDFNLPLSETLALGFWMYLLLGVGAIPMGLLGDRWKPSYLLIIMLWGVGCGSLICACSMSPQILMLGLALIGVAASIYHPVGIGLISKCCQNRGTALGHNGVCGNLGIGLGPFIAALFAYGVSAVGEGIQGWRIAFAVMGLIPIGVGIVMLGKHPDDRPLVRENDTKETKAPASAMVGYFVLMLLCMLLLGICYRGTSIVLPAYFEGRISFVAELFRRFSDVQISGTKSFGAALLAAAVYLFAILGQVVGGRIADRMDLRAAYLLFHLLSLPFILLMGVLSELPLFMVAMMYMFFSLGMQPIENSLLAKLTPDRMRSFAYGLKFVLTFGCGGSIAVKLVEWFLVRDQSSMLFFSFARLIAMVVLLIVLLYVLSRRYRFRNI